MDIADVFSYNPETGDFFWKIAGKGRSLDKPAGSMHRLGYRKLFHDGVYYQGHRVAWYLVHGEWPPHQIDHIDGNPANNRLSNLRLATQAENSRNRRGSGASGIKGTYWFQNKWNARIIAHGKRIYLGGFPTQEQAANAYREAALKHFGAFARVA